MSRGLITESLALFLIAATGLAATANPVSESLQDGSVLQVSLANVYEGNVSNSQITVAPNSTITLNVTDVSSNTLFFVVQVHTYQYNVTLSYDKNHLHTASNRSVFGSNIGLFVRPDNHTIITPVYLRNDNDLAVHVAVAAVPYGPLAPVPGGCNMEFNTEIAPYGKVTVRNATVTVDIQPPSVPIRNGLKPNCDKNSVQIKMYQMYLYERDFSPEGYFIAIGSMLTVSDIMENGYQVSDSSMSSIRRIFSAYTGTGSVYVAVAEFNGHYAAYVPSFTYACNPVTDPESCDILNSGFQKFVCAACFFLGLVFILKGHKSLSANLSMPVLFFGTMNGYIWVLDINSDYQSSSNIASALAIGVVFVICWNVGKRCLGEFFGTTLICLTLGYFITCIAYFQFADVFFLLHSNWFFWILMFCIMAVTCLMSAHTNIVFNITCAIYTSYMMVLPLDYGFGSSLKYIVINMIRRSTVDDFDLAIVQPPVQTRDVFLIVLWVLLALGRFVTAYKSASASYDPLLD